MKNLATIVVVFAVIAALAGTSQTAVSTTSKAVPQAEAGKDSTDKAKEKPVIEGSDSKGKYYYKKSCKSCHGPKGNGGEVTPVSKTTRQWERYFKKGVHLVRENEDGEKIKDMLIDIMDFTDPMNPVPVYMPFPAQDLKNTEAWSARLRLKMDARIGKEVHFTGRLNMNRGYGASGIPLFNGFPNTVLHAFNSTATPVDNRIMVERAAFTWDPDEIPLFFTLGRQARPPVQETDKPQP
jgi:cytochrome c5